MYCNFLQQKMITEFEAKDIKCERAEGQICARDVTGRDCAESKKTLTNAFPGKNAIWAPKPTE